MINRVVRFVATRRLILGCAVVVAASSAWVVTRAQVPSTTIAPNPGAQLDGTILLPNGWHVAPVGKSLTVGTMPLGFLITPDGKYAITTNNGIGAASFSVVDLDKWTVKSTIPVDSAWLGLVWHPDGHRLYSAAANLNAVQEYTYADGTLTLARTLTLPAQQGDTFVGGLAISPDGRTLYATRVFAMTLSAIDIASGQVTKTVTLPSEPYTCAVSPDGRRVYVSVWGSADVRAFAADSLAVQMDFATGEHPSGMAISPDGKRLFVAAANSAVVNVFDTFSGIALEEISMTLFTDQPPTTTPTALTLSQDGRTLLVAVADLNAVAVVDVSNIARSFVDGFIPTGAYPTAVSYSRDGKQILVLGGRGNAPAANPLTGGFETRLRGILSMVAVPDRVTLNDYTRRLYALTPYSDAMRLTPANIPIGSPIPRVVGGSSPIKHVFYIIRENRTYDQILGDVPQGNGDPKLAIFGRDVTPNAHALAQTFTLFDNFYVDADVSYDGHAYSTAAYATDVVQKLWQTYYANRGGPYLGEGAGMARNPFGNLTAPAQGYLWDYAQRAGVSVRSYGEYVTHGVKNKTGQLVVSAAVPGLVGLVAPSFAGFDMDITDNSRVDAWMTEFIQYQQTNTLPQLSIIHLPDDHTKGTTPGSPTPRAMMADNDLALGRIVEAVSNSAYWKDSAIIVVEDDAQSGPDHVDSHRSILLVASPFVKRGAVDHTFYTTSGVLRTIELLLGLEPMSQYDASAAPLYNAFVGVPDLTSYLHEPARVPLTEKNVATSYGAQASAAMNFADEDRAPEALLNEIIWRSVKGAHARVPAPRRSIFVRGSVVDLDDDDR